MAPTMSSGHQYQRKQLTGTKSLQSQQSCSSLPVHTLPSTSSAAALDVHFHESKPMSMCKRFLKTSSLDEYSTERKHISTVSELTYQMDGGQRERDRTDLNSIELIEVIPAGPDGQYINPSDEYMMMTARQQVPMAQRILNFFKVAWHEMTSNESIGSSEEGKFLVQSKYCCDNRRIFDTFS